MLYSDVCHIHVFDVVEGVHVLHAASNCQLLQLSHLEAPGPEKSPFAQAVHVLEPALLKVPAKQGVHTNCPAATWAHIPAAH